MMFSWEECFSFSNTTRCSSSAVWKQHIVKRRTTEAEVRDVAIMTLLRSTDSLFLSLIIASFFRNLFFPICGDLSWNPRSDGKLMQDVEDMKKRLKEMEDEAAALREMQAKAEKEMGAVQDPAAVAADQVNKEEIDSRSVFVGNVDYACTPEEVQQHFQSCGTVNRVTIRTNKYGQPKGYAYVEFLEPDAVQEALHLNESVLHGRQIKVLAKRTNVPGMKQFRPRRVNPYMAYGFRGACPPPSYFYSPYGYGKGPRFRMPMRYGPY